MLGSKITEGNAIFSFKKRPRVGGLVSWNLALWYREFGYALSCITASH